MKLKKFSHELSEKYRKGDYSLPADEHLEAYRVVRMPATWAAIKQTLHEIRGLPIESLLDLGAGPATGWRAAKEVFPSLSRGTFVEKDKRWEAPFEGTSWIFADLKNLPALDVHDLVLFSYSLGEIPQNHWDALLGKSFSLARLALVIVEPGTPPGFARIRSVRDKLLALGAHILAPCPHIQKCPMTGNDWCHFAARTVRTSQHRQAKGGTLGYEDEKFSYLIVSNNYSPCAGRILRPPIVRSGHISMSVCSSDGQIKNRIYSRKQGEVYKKAKKLEWGSQVSEI